MSNKFIDSTIQALATPQKPPLPPLFSSLQVRHSNHAPQSAKLLRTHNIARCAVFFAREQNSTHIDRRRVVSVTIALESNRIIDQHKFAPCLEDVDGGAQVNN